VGPRVLSSQCLYKLTSGTTYVTANVQPASIKRPVRSPTSGYRADWACRLPTQRLRTTTLAGLTHLLAHLLLREGDLQGTISFCLLHPIPLSFASLGYHESRSIFRRRRSNRSRWQWRWWRRSRRCTARDSHATRNLSQPRLYVFGDHRQCVLQLL